MTNNFEKGQVLNQRELYAEVKAKYPEYYEAVRHYMYDGPKDGDHLEEIQRWKNEQQPILKAMAENLGILPEESSLMFKAVSLDVEGSI